MISIGHQVIWLFLLAIPIACVAWTVTHEEVTSEELGGAMTHATKSGVTHFACANEVEAINYLKKLLSYVPQNCEEEAPAVPYTAGNEIREELNSIIPDNANQPYDIREVIEHVIDTETFFEVIVIPLSRSKSLLSRIKSPVFSFSRKS